MEVEIMEDFVNKFISFILFLVNAIKDMVATLSGKAKPADSTTEATAGE